MTTVKHPSEVDLALYAGKDLGFWAQRAVGRHVLNCAQCQHEIHCLQQGTDNLRDLAAQLAPDLNWNRLSQEMTGNIRVGFAAGECIAGFETRIRPGRPRFIRHTAGVLSAATAVVVLMLWVNLPRGEWNHAMTALGQIRWQRIGMLIHPPTLAQDAVVLEASPFSIEVKANGRSLTLMHPRSEGATVSMNMQNSAGVRFVDADTGQVTMDKVYYGQ